jgi:pimeloyl-ACP methyl ester carboxylesterase
MGMSLGGYAASLYTTVHAGSEFLVPIIPLACLADFAKQQRRLSEDGSKAARQQRLLRRAYAQVAPLSREPLISSERVLVIGAEADRITPVSHARRLAAHFQASLDTWPGGHVLQFGRRAAFSRIRRLLETVLATG